MTSTENYSLKMRTIRCNLSNISKGIIRKGYGINGTFLKISLDGEKNNLQLFPKKDR